MNDYERVAKVIHYLEAHQEGQPSLDELAGVVGLSAAHFHRMFRRWAGVTPKDFLQCLTVESAKSRLRESAAVLEASLDVGLSGPGRLHDHFVSLEAASPGEFKSGGRGLLIEWGEAESPFGLCSLGWNPRGVCHLAFHDKRILDVAEVSGHWPHAHWVRDDLAAGDLATRIFTRPVSGSGRLPPLQAFVRGTSFQLKVWKALLQIPEAGLASYQTVARFAGKPKAFRAVGTACGANPVAFLIPCHRVIRETGVVQGYRWGSTRKQAILAWEFAR
ncbi:MAG: methylated-DNA--[protein]-cysteine S-methyltransferase [Terrimicrobiaceae bacterium]